MKRFLTAVRAPILQNDGTTGATAATRWVGATASGAPASGTFAVGDFVIAQNGHAFICTGAGTPGTWVDVGSVGNLVTSVAGRTGAVVLTAADVGGGTFPGAYTFSNSLTTSLSNGSYVLTDGTNTVRTALASSAGSYHTSTQTGDAVVRGDAAGNTQGVLLAAGPTSTGYVRVASAGVTVGGTLNSTGNLSENGNRVYSAGNAPPYPVTQVAGRTGAVTLTAADVAAGTFPSGNFVFQGTVTGATAVGVAGLTGATSATRYVGGTASGAPASGTFVTGDFIIAQNGHVWICTAGGSPGTWVDASSGSGTPATTVTSETTYGIASAVGTSTNYARQDHTHGSPATPVTSAVAGTGIGVSGATGAVTITNNGVTSIGVGARTGAVTLTAADIGAGTFPGANSYSGLQTFNAGITVPSGQALLTGTRSVVTGTRATTTNASDTVDLGTFSTTGGALELRIHAHLAAPGAGTTASVTKIYEVAAGALMGTVSTWYLCLPADASANAAATNDFALEVQRTAAGTFQFRFRQKSIGIAGQITFTAETLGDVAVTFTPSTTVTAAPAAVSTVHPSNAFVAAAGNVGIGTDSPAHLLEVNGQINGVGVLDNGTQVYSPQNTNLSGSVSSETSFGVSAFAGSATTYSRGDHTHGSPATPVTAVSAGGGINLSGPTGAVVISNSGVTSAVAGTGISVSGATGAVTITNTGATSVAGRTGAVTLTAADIGSGSTFPSGNYAFQGLITPLTDQTQTVGASNVRWSNAFFMNITNYAGSTSGTTCIFSSGNLLARSSSSRRYKTNIRDHEELRWDVLDLKPVTYHMKGDLHAGFTGEYMREVGLIAEDVHEAGFPDLVQYEVPHRVVKEAEETEHGWPEVELTGEPILPESVKYDRIAVMLLPLIKELRKQNSDLLRRVEALEARR